MKTFSSLFLLTCSLFTFGQTTITSVANGNANNPFTWDCTCFPTPADHVIVNHDVIMNVDWIVNNGGSITVNSAGSFIQDANYRSILVDGTNSEFHNSGQTELTNMAFSNGGAGHNHGMLSLDTALWVGAGASFMNHATTTGLDSTLIQGTFSNMGSFAQGDFWNDGIVNNSGNLTTDSLLNTGTFNSTAGEIVAIDFANSDAFSLTGTSYLNISNDFFNTGTFTLGTGRDVNVGNDFWTGETGGTALIDNDGLIVVGNDFTNTNNLDGGGVFCIANSSTNTGDVSGSLDICDNTGSGYFDLNTGTIGVTVTDCVSSCFVGKEELKKDLFSMYPNPANNILMIDHTGYASMQIVDLTGKVVYSINSPVNSVDISDLSNGIYFVSISSKGQTTTKKLIKQ